MAGKSDEAGTLNALTIKDQRGNVPTGVDINGTKFAVKQQVNVPILKHESGQTVAVQILLPVRKEISEREVEVLVAGGEVVKGMQASEINIVRVTELSSGLMFELVLNAISASSFDRSYPDQSYVGKYFAIRKLGVVEGKRYKQVEIVEIEPETAITS